MYSHLYGVSATILRASNPYGERQGHSGVQGVIGTFINRILNKESIEIWGDGSVVRDFIYILDLIDLCICVANEKITGVFNAGSVLGHSINEVLMTIEEVSKSKIDVTYTAGRVYDVPNVILNIEKAKENFKWNPQTNLAQGIGKHWDWASKR